MFMSWKCGEIQSFWDIVLEDILMEKQKQT